MSQNQSGFSSFFIILLIILLLGIIIGGGAMYLYLSQSPQPSLPTCPSDFQTCPDGSKVYRLPPDCQFPQCPSIDTMSVKVFWGHSSFINEPPYDCSKTLPVERKISKSSNPVKVAIEMFLTGPTDEEKNQGFMSIFPIKKCRN